MKFPDHSDLTTVTIEDVGEFRVTMDRIGAVDPRDHWYEEYVDATAELAPLRAQYAAQLNLTIEAKGEIDTLRADLTIADTTAANLHDEIRKRDEAIATLRAALRELRGKVEGLACDCENHADCQMECHVWNDDRVVSLAAVLDLIDRELEP